MTARTVQVEMKMPDLAATESEVKVARWLVAEGQAVKRGQPVLEVETDKATMEVESVVSGVLARVVAKAGESIAVGQVIAVFNVEAGASAQGGAAPSDAAPSGTASDPRESAVSSFGPGAPKDTADSARGRAALAVPLGATPPPSGMFARNRAAAASKAAPPSPSLPLTVAQKTAGRRLQESKQTVPHFYLQSSVNAARMAARRAAAAPRRLAWDAFFVFALARAMERFERIACRLEGDHLVKPTTDAVGVAVDHEGDLYVLPIAAPAGRPPEEISDDLRARVERLRAGDAEARRMLPARMTVTNLGICGVESFSPIINPPEAAILGVGKVSPTPVARGGQVVIEERAVLTLAVDHRVVSGKYAGDFLAAVVAELESL